MQMNTNPKPVIFLAFANEQEGGRYLRNLPKELNLIRQALEPAEAAGLCELVIRSNTSIEDIIDTFQSERYRGRIAVFHYGGHADGFQLLLESLEGNPVIAHGEGLVPFLGKQSGLQFIFLNGCSTQEQAEKLIAAGVPAVIGTAQSISDDTATQLSVRFYKGLGSGLSLDHTWREAVDEQRMRIGSKDLRGIKLKGPEATDQFPWDLYIREGAENVESWNLPAAAQNPLFGLPELALTDLPEEPYRFLDRYRPEHAPVFFGRSYYIRDLFERTNDPSSAPLVLLYGQSGVGKSSMLEAGLLPRLEAVCRVIELRRDVQKGLVHQLRDALATLSDENTSDKGGSLQAEIQKLEKFAETAGPEIRPDLEVLLKELSGKLEALRNPGEGQSLRDQWLRQEQVFGKPLVIILDQVEETITRPLADQPNELDQLLDELKLIFDNPQERPRGKLILSYRKEYHPEILAACKERRIPREEVFLEPLSRKDIIEVITGLTSTPQLQRAYRLEVEEHLPGTIADHLLSDKDAPVAPILQILLTKLWRLSMEEDHPRFTADGFNQLLKEGVLLDDFFQQQLEQLRQWNAEAENSGLVLDILNFHTTQWQTAGEHKLEDLRKRYEHHQDLIDNLVARVKELFLMAGSGRDRTRLAHDTLAPIVQREMKISDRPGQRALRILENKARTFAYQAETFIDIEDLQIVEDGQHGMRLWTTQEKELIEKSRRRREELLAERRRNRRFRRVAIVMLAIFAGVVSILAYRTSQQAEAATLVSRALELEKNDATQAFRLVEAALEKTPADPSIRQIQGQLFGNQEFYQRALSTDAALTATAITSDGSRMAAVDAAGKLWIWQAHGILQDTLMVHPGGALAVRFSPDDQFLLTGGEDKLAKLWGPDGQLVATFAGHHSAVQAVSFAANGKEILTGSRDKTAIRWAANGDTLQVYRGHGGTIYDLAFSDKTQQLVTGSEDSTAILWAADGRLIRRFSEHTDRVLSVSFSEDGRSVLTGSRDKSVILRDTSGRFKGSFIGHDARVNRAVFAPDGASVLTASDDQQLIQWNLDGTVRRTFQGHFSYVNDLAISADGRFLVSAGEDQSLKVWPVNAKTYREVRHGTEAIGAAGLSNNGQWLATAGYRVYADPIDEEFDMDDKSQDIKLWDREGRLIKTFAGHTNSILSMAFSPDDQWLLTGSKDGTARLWSVDTSRTENQPVLSLSVHNGRVTAVAFAPDGNSFLTAGADSTARLWSLTGDSIAVFRGHEDWLTSVAFAPDGKHFLTGSYDQTIRKWSANQPETPPQIFSGHTAAVMTLACSPDGRLVISGGEDNTARLWNNTGELQMELQQSDQNATGYGAILSLGFSSDGTTFALGGSDGTARIYQSAGNLVQTLNGAGKGLVSIGFSNDNRYILTAGEDGYARLVFRPKGFLETDWIAPLKN